jgi:hypothetical protein
MDLPASGSTAKERRKALPSAVLKEILLFDGDFTTEERWATKLGDTKRKLVPEVQKWYDVIAPHM